MFSNLLDNAIKYTPSGGRVDVTIFTGPPEEVTVSIQDTGIGIADDELPHIFDRFYRGDRSRSTSGVGLGLSLSRAIARAHGGDIKVSTMPGRGSTFVVTLPRREAVIRN
jgi:signal transduction histidine kinase